jgi:hypothetical protein
MSDNRDLPRRPAPEQFAAYVDGELGPADQAALEDWLLDHPDDRAEVDAGRRLAELMRATTAPDPGEAAWAGVLERLAAAPPPRMRRPGRRVRWIALAAVAAVGLAAAAVVFALLPGKIVEKTVEPLHVVADDDVEIVRMDGGDTGSLVVGQPPMHGAFILASADDVTVIDTGHDVEVVVPEELPGGHNGPMIVRPQDPPPDKD